MTAEPAARKRAFRDAAICGAALIYVVLVLCINLDSPLMGIALILLAAHELLASYRQRRRRTHAAADLTCRSRQA